MRPGRLATSLAAMWASIVAYIAPASEHDPVDLNIQDAKHVLSREGIVWQAKAKPRRRGCFP